MPELRLPISAKEARNLHAGDLVSLSGVVVTARDAAHKYMVEQLINQEPTATERPVYEALQQTLRDGAIYHCGPVMEKIADGWQVVAAGPTTSAREEEYEDLVIAHFGVRVIIGKGGMGLRTRQACQEHGAVYLHAVGGAAALIAGSIKRVLGVWKTEFGMPEALWQLEMANMQLLVTIDAHGNSWHDEVAQTSGKKLAELLKLPAKQVGE